MAKKKKLSRDQKRKQKLQRRRRGTSQGLQPYRGGKYRSKKYVMALMRAEVGIYETYLMTERQLTDRQVEAGLKNLIQELRSGPIQPAEQRDVVDVKPGAEMDLLSWNIRRNWDDLFATQPRHSNVELAGILRTILDSIETWSTPGADSQGYLNYLEGFLTKAGVKVEKVPLGGESWEEEEVESDEAYLLDVGLEWLETKDAGIKREFFEEAEAMIEEGQAEAVINVCQHLIGRANDRALIDELRPLLQLAYRKLGVPFGAQLPQRRRLS
jgi:hypothetical protein